MRDTDRGWLSESHFGYGIQTPKPPGTRCSLVPLGLLLCSVDSHVVHKESLGLGLSRTNFVVVVKSLFVSLLSPTLPPRPS